MLALVYQRYDSLFMEFPKIIYEEGDDLPRIRSILGPRVGAPSPSSPPSLKSPAPPTPSPATVKSIPLKSSASVAETHARLWQPGKRVAPQAAEEVEQTPTLPAQAQAPAPPTVLGGWNPARRWQGGTPAVAPEAAPLAKEPSVELTTPSLAPAQEQTPKLSLAHTPPPLITVEPESTAVADAMVAEVESATHRIGSVSGRAVGAQAPNRGAPPSRLSSLFDADALSTQPLDPVLDAEVLPAMAARVIVDRVGAILSLGNTTLGALGVPGELQAPPETRVASIAEPQPTLQPLPTIEAVELSKPPAVPGLVKPSALTPPEHPQSVVASSLMQGASESLDPVKAVASPASCDLAAAVPAPVETRGVALQVEVPSAAAPVLFDPVEDEAPQEPVSDAAENPEADANGLSLTATDDLQVQSAPDAVPTDNPSGHGSLSDRAVEAAIGEGVPTEVCAADANGPSAVQAVVVEPPNAIAPTQAIEERDVAPPVIHLGEIDMAYGWRASVAAKAKARSDAAIRHQNPSIVAAERANALPAGQTHGGKNPNLVTISIVTEATVDAPIVPVINVGEPDAHPNPVESAIANVTNGGEKDAALANTQSAPEVEDNDFEGADAIAESDSNIVLAVVEALVVGENEATEAVPPSLPPIGPEDGSDLVNTDEGPEEDPNEAPECVVQGIYNAPTSPAFDAKDRSAILTGNVAATLQDLDCDADADLADIPTSTMTIPPTIPSLSNPQDRLVQACLEGQFKLVGALLADGADPNAAGRATSTDGSAWEGITPLQATILATASVEEITPKMLRKQTARIVKVLLSRGCGV